LRKADDALNRARYDEIIEITSRCVDERPNASLTAWAHALRACALLARNEPHRALKDLNLSRIEMRSSKHLDAQVVTNYNSSVSERLAECYAQLGRTDEALSAVNESLRSDITDVRLKLKGELLSQLDRNREALACFSKGLELNPKAYWLWIDRGRLYARLKKFENAIGDFTRAIELRPQDSRAYCERAGVWEVMGQKLRAKKDLEKVSPLGVIEFNY
jgi:tetratricopeptide (TPR) repeat protein